MALFHGKEGGLMDVIRCDEPEYLVWKWRPSGEANSTHRENAIRYGSRLRVKDGEMAVFVYPQKNGNLQDYLIGPLDITIDTANFPILTDIIGLAFAGNSPFQAEVYFINLEGNNQVKFGIPYFDIYDPRFKDLSIPCAVRGTITFNVTDYKNFIKLNRLIDFDLDALHVQVKDAFIRKAKSVIANIPEEENIPVLQIERKIEDINQMVASKVKELMSDDFGINLKRVDIAAIEVDKTSKNYAQLNAATAEQQVKIAQAKTDIEIENLSETMRIARKKMEMDVEGQNLNVHVINTQADVLKAAATGLGNMGSSDTGGGAGFNPAGMMAGMAIGGAMGQQMAGMAANMGQSTGGQVPPPVPGTVSYLVVVDGQQYGPYTVTQLQQMAQNKQFTPEHLVWRQGMSAWEMASNVADLSAVFATIPPPLPI